jgi:hypothetical protein
VAVDHIDIGIPIRAAADGGRMGIPTAQRRPRETNGAGHQDVDFKAAQMGMGPHQHRGSSPLGNASAGQLQKQPDGTVDGPSQIGRTFVEARHVELILCPAQGGAAVPALEGQAVDHHPHEDGISQQ